MLQQASNGGPGGRFRIRRAFRTAVTTTSWSGAARAQAQSNALLVEQIRPAHAASNATYGVPCNQVELADQGIEAGHNRIASKMRANGLRGGSRRREWCVTTKRGKEHRPAPDLVQRKFTATGINQLWVADMTYIATWAGFAYLGVVLDVYSRKVVGRAIATWASAIDPISTSSAS